MTTLILDNYDSFTWNLVQQVHAISGSAPVVARNDEISWDDIVALRPDRVILSPGPGRPDNLRDFGICRRVIEELDIPILGVCLGHQGICASFGAPIEPAPEIMHGRVSRIVHNRDSLFRGVPGTFLAVRYHSWIAGSAPGPLETIAWTEDGLIMGVRHRSRPLWGVQFHPESILTEHGDQIIANFLGRPRRLQPALTTPIADPPPYSRLITRDRSFDSDPSLLFRRLFARETNAFWLDGAASRFSYMGASDTLIESPVLERLERDLAENRIASRPDLPFSFLGGWVGYLGYESKAELGVPGQHQSHFPDARFLYVDRFVVLDHEEQRLWLVCSSPERDAKCWIGQMEARLDQNVEALFPPAAEPPDLTPGAPQRDHAAAVDECLEQIRTGESYEICLTTQFRGATRIAAIDHYEALRTLNPAPYAAYLQFPDFQIACASPELFLSVTSCGHITSKPIKGTSPRGVTLQEDRLLREQLAGDEKNRAENLMITDLVRNDLGRIAEPGSVAVTRLMDIESFATVHQMVSTIEARLRPGSTAIDAIRAAFPPGSMTGAPKLRTMEIIDRVETEARGIYSGSIGYLSRDGAARFNVVIRTAVFAEGEVSIGSGGAVVAQSTPNDEWREVMLKTEALTRGFEWVRDRPKLLVTVDTTPSPF